MNVNHSKGVTTIRLTKRETDRLRECADCLEILARAVESAEYEGAATVLLKAADEYGAKVTT